jgi:hypothetical protein
MKESYEIGDDTWIATGTGILIKGKVIQDLKIENEQNKFYLIKIDTGIESIYEVREADTMAENPAGPLGYMKNLGREW